MASLDQFRLACQSDTDDHLHSIVNSVGVYSAAKINIAQAEIDNRNLNNPQRNLLKAAIDSVPQGQLTFIVVDAEGTVTVAGLDLAAKMVADAIDAEDAAAKAAEPQIVA